MKSPLLPENEPQRLIALKSYKILDTYTEEIFDDFTRLASQICATPIALITLLDETRQWFKSTVGLDATETPRNISFCGHAILENALFEIPNALEDERFQDNPLVTGKPNIRFYAGEPLTTGEGYILGTLCVIDTIPRQLTPEQRTALKMLARQVVSQIEYHLTLLQMAKINQELSEKSSFYDTLLCSADESIISTNIDGIITSFSIGAEAMLGYRAEELIGQNTPLILHDANQVIDRAAELSLALSQTIKPDLEVFTINARNGPSETREWAYIHKDGTRLPVNLTVTAMHNNTGALMGFLEIAQDITLHKQTQQMLANMSELLEQTAEMAKIGGWELDLKTMQMQWTKEAFHIYELESTQQPTVREAISFYAPQAQPMIKAAIELAITNGTAWSLELPFITAKGRHIWMCTQGYAVMKDGKANRLKGVFQDITERRKSELDLVWLNRALQMLSKCNEILIHMTDETKLIIEICRIAVDVGGYRMAWVGYAEDDEYKSITPKAYFGHNNEFLNNINLSWSEDQVNGRGPSGRTIRNGQVTIVKDVMLDPSYPVKEQAAKEGYHALVSLPLKDKDRIFGLLALYSAEAHTFAKGEIRLLQELTDNLAAGIISIRIEKEGEQLHSSMLKIATAVSLTGGEAFFSQLLSNMTSVLNAQAGYVAKLLPEEPLKNRTIAVQVDGKPVDNYDYLIPDVLAKRLFGNNDLCIVNDYAARDYPNLSMMAFFKYQAFAALRLHNSSNHPIGLLFVLFKEPIKQHSHDLISSMLKIFAARTASELERLETDNLIQEQASLLDKTRDAIVVRDLEHRVTFWNKGAEALYGWSAEEALGQPTYELLQLETVEFSQAVNILLREDEWIGEIVIRHKNGDLLIIESHWTLVKDKFGQPKSIFAIESNISDRKMAEEEIRQLAFYDPLTKLSNRRLLMDRLGKAIITTVRNKQYGALIFIDLDNFKTLNDTMGHDTGDLLLQEVGKRLSDCVREIDTVARLGGDEFVIVLEDLSGVQDQALVQARVVGEKILQALNQIIDFDGFQHISTPSIGVAMFDHQTESIDELLKQADMAMYKSKAAGRNTLSFFE